MILGLSFDRIHEAISGHRYRANIPLFKRLHELRGRNAWPHLFYAAVLKDEELLAHLKDGDLPELL